MLFRSPRIYLINSTDLLSHKIHTAKFSLDQTVQVSFLVFSLGLGLGSSEYLITTWDQSSAGISGRMQIFATD